VAKQKASKIWPRSLRPARRYRGTNSAASSYRSRIRMGRPPAAEITARAPVRFLDEGTIASGSDSR
jgi:hypothetical protein